jgi:malonate-semialdehyde dehydrogenase (acetylating) / methylmalonate-semialdehyde dehydrogenase
VSTITAPNAKGNSGTRTLHHWVAGAHHKGSGNRFSHVTDPATGEVTARLALASVADVDAAVTVAKAAFPRWRDTSLAGCTEVVARFRELLDARAAELAELITVEHGKFLGEAR